MSETSTQPLTFYGVMEERPLPSDRIPTPEELHQVIDALDGVQEFLTGAVSHGVIDVGITNKPNSVDWEQIGRLVEWADHVRWILETIGEDAARVSIMAREVFPALARGFTFDSTPPFNKYGTPETSGYHDNLRRRLGFNNV